MDTGRLLAFVLVATILIAIPGPSVLFILGRALAHGRRVAILAVIGNSAGEFLQVLAVSVGVGSLVERSALAFILLKVAGALYLLQLGVRTVQHRHWPLPGDPGPKARIGGARGIFDGFFVGATNPKSAVFFVAILPQFVARQGPPAVIQLLTLGVIWVALALVSDGCWAVAGAGARRWLQRSPRRTAAVGTASGVSTACLGLVLLLTGNRA